MRQTTPFHHARHAALLSRYDQRATIVRPSDAPSSSIGSPYDDDGTRAAPVIHSDVPARFEARIEGTGERAIGSADIATTRYYIGLQGILDDIGEQDEVQIGDDSFNIVSVGVQRLAQRTRINCVRKP